MKNGVNTETGQNLLLNAGYYRILTTVKMGEWSSYLISVWAKERLKDGETLNKKILEIVKPDGESLFARVVPNEEFLSLMQEESEAGVT